MRWPQDEPVHADCFSGEHQRGGRGRMRAVWLGRPVMPCRSSGTGVQPAVPVWNRQRATADGRDPFSRVRKGVFEVQALESNSKGGGRTATICPRAADGTRRAALQRCASFLAQEFCTPLGCSNLKRSLMLVMSARRNRAQAPGYFREFPVVPSRQSLVEQPGRRICSTRAPSFFCRVGQLELFAGRRRPAARPNPGWR